MKWIALITFIIVTGYLFTGKTTGDQYLGKEEDDNGWVDTRGVDSV